MSCFIYLFVLFKLLPHYVTNALANDLANVEANVCSCRLRPHYVANDLTNAGATHAVFAKWRMFAYWGAILLAVYQITNSLVHICIYWRNLECSWMLSGNTRIFAPARQDAKMDDYCDRNFCRSFSSNELFLSLDLLCRERSLEEKWSLNQSRRG